MLNKKDGFRPPRKLGTILVRGEGSAAGRRFADDVDGANSRPSPVREKGDRGAGEEVWRNQDVACDRIAYMLSYR